MFIYYLEHKEIILTHKSTSISALPVLKYGSIGINIRITGVSISNASKYFLVSDRGHISLACTTLPNLHISMLICYFKQIV